MKRPTWGTVIGILMIAFGGCSVLNNLQAIKLPAKLDEKKTELREKMKESEAAVPDSLEAKSVDSTMTEHEHKIELAKNVLDMPEATKTWIVRFGYLGIGVALLYALGGVLLLSPKNFSIKFVYGVLILSIGFTATKTIVLLSPGSSSGVIALTMGATQLFSIIIDIILLSVIFSSENKEYYTT